MATIEDIDLPLSGERAMPLATSSKVFAAYKCSSDDLDRPQTDSECYFSHPVYRHRYGQDNLARITFKKDLGERCAWFSINPHLRHLGRLEKFNGGEINQIASKVFAAGGRDFLVFPELPVADAALEEISFPKLVFATQSNWKLDISAEHFGLSPKNRKNHAYRYKRLIKTLGREPEFVFRKATEKDFRLVYETAHRRLIANGIEPHGGEEKRREMEAVSSEIGYFAGCFDGETLIAGNIMYVTNSRAFGILTAMSPEFFHCSPGLIAHKFTMQSLFELGITEVNLMWGDSPYKQSLGAVEERLCTVIVARSVLDFVKPGFVSAAIPAAIIDLKRRIRALQRNYSRKKR